MKTKSKTPAPVHSVAILPDGSTLPLPGCKRYVINDNGEIIIKNVSDGGLTLAILPPGSTLITNWTHPNHA